MKSFILFENFLMSSTKNLQGVVNQTFGNQTQSNSIAGLSWFSSVIKCITCCEFDGLNVQVSFPHLIPLTCSRIRPARKRDWLITRGIAVHAKPKQFKSCSQARLCLITELNLTQRMSWLNPQIEFDCIWMKQFLFCLIDWLCQELC